MRRRMADTETGPHAERATAPVHRAAASMVAAAVVAGPVRRARPRKRRAARSCSASTTRSSELTGNDAQKIAQSGAKTLRWMFVWPRIESKQGVFNWSAPDKLVGDLAAKGIRVLPDPLGIAEMGGEVSSDGPDRLTGGARRVEAVPDRGRESLRARGAYWTDQYPTDHPGKPALPIGTWQIWNEPNLRSAMSPGRPRATTRSSWSCPTARSRPPTRARR